MRTTLVLAALALALPAAAGTAAANCHHESATVALCIGPLPPPSPQTEEQHVGVDLPFVVHDLLQRVYRVGVCASIVGCTTPGTAKDMAEAAVCSAGGFLYPGPPTQGHPGPVCVNLD